MCAGTHGAALDVSEHLKHLHLALRLPLVLVDVAVREGGRQGAVTGAAVNESMGLHVRIELDPLLFSAGGEG